MGMVSDGRKWVTVLITAASVPITPVTAAPS